MTIKGLVRKGKKKEMEMEIERSIWTEKGIELYHERCKGWTCKQTENEKIWKEIEEKVSFL